MTYGLVQNIPQDDDDCLKFLITTDNHLGFKEKHKIINNDSFDAFEEAL